MVVPAYLVAVAAAQAVQGFVSAGAGVAANAVLVLVMANHALVGGRLAEEEDPTAVGRSPDGEAVAVLGLVPLLGVVGGSLPPLPDSVAWDGIVTAVMLVSAALVARPAPVRSVSTLLAADVLQLPTAIAGAVLGLGAFLALRPEAIVDASESAPIVLGTVAVLMAGGATWELVFRGMLQPTLASAMGGTGVVATAMVSAAAAAATGRAGYAVVMALVGAVLGAVVHRTGSILGAAAGQALLIVGLLVVWPLVLG